MTQTLEAVFEEGKFKPLENGSLPFSEGQRVRLTVETPNNSQGDLIELASHVYDGLRDKDIDEIETIALDRSKFFHDSLTS